MIAEQNLKTMKHLDEEHCAWLLVLGKTHKDFQHKLFLYRFPEIIPKIYDIREIVGLRIAEWDNKNPKDPVRQCQNEINKRCDGFETSKETVNRRISTTSEHSQETTEDETSFGRLYKRLKLSLWK